MGFFRLALLFGLMAPVAGATAAEERMRALTHERGCTACHGMLRKQVGPGFAQIADRYRNDPAAPSQLAAKIRNGSVGTWGRVIMPRQPHVSEADARLLARWILSLPSPP